MSASEEGFELSWQSFSLLYNGQEFTGITGCKYGQKVTREMVYGAGAYPLGRTEGKVENDEASITFLELELRAFLAALGNGYGRKAFQLVAQYGAPGTPTFTDVLERCMLSGDGEGGGEEGTDAFKREVPFTFLRVKRNGLYIVDTSIRR